MGCLKIIRTILALVISVILFLLIVVGIPASSLAKLASESENVKNWIKNSGVYDKLSDVFVEVMLEKVNKEEIDFLDFTTEEELKEIVRGVATPSWLEENVGKIIDAMYDWLSGETKEPTFEIELTGQQQGLISAFSDLVKLHLQNLPICKDTNQYNQTNFDPFKAECLPASYSIDEIDKELEKNLPSDMFGKEKITSEELFKQNKIPESLTQKLQQFFGYFEKLQMFVVILILILTLVIFILVPGFKNGFLFTGLVWVISSSALLFGGYYSKNNFDSFFESQMGKINSMQVELVSDLVKEPVKLAYFDTLTESSKLGMVVVVLGMILAFGGIILKLSRRRYYVREETPEESLDDHVEDEDVEQLEEAINLEGKERISKSLGEPEAEVKTAKSTTDKSGTDSTGLPTSPLSSPT